MKNTEIKTKISTISVILLLVISAILVTLPAVNAQTYNLIMNTSTTGIYGSPHAVDLNGPSEQLTGLKFAYIPPGGTEWIITTEPPIDNEPGLPGERYVTDSGGDCDIEWTATDGKGDYQVKWVHPASGSESDVVTVTLGDPPTLVTYPFIGAVPNPVGAGQTVLLHVGIFQQLTRQPMGWDMEVMIEDPTGQTTTITDIMTDSTGGTGVTFTPTMVGIYKLRSHFPEQILTPEKTAPGAGVGSIMKESFSAVLELEVQTDPIPYYPGHSLPNEYWTRPIDPQLREWTRIAGSSWLHSISDSDQYVVTGNEDAPDSAHILWTKEVTQGGIAGGVREANSEWAFSHGDAYEGIWNHRMIINGILIYTHRTNIRPLVYTAVNVRTGEVMWEKTFLDNQSISFGQNLVWGGYNHHAVYSYLWVTPRNRPWYAFDPYTGDLRFTVENVPGGTTLFDDQGWLYRVNTNDGYIWSMTHLLVPIGEPGSSGGTFTPGRSYYGEYDAEATGGSAGRAAERAYITEFDWPSGLPNQRAIALGDKAFGLRYSTTEIRTWAVSLEPGNEGTLLYDKTWAAPAWWEEGNVQIEFNTISLEDDAAVFWIHDTLEYYCFSTDTGEYKWGPAEPEYYANYYGWTELGERPPMIWEGKLYSTGTGGVIYCYDLDDGEVLWTYEADDPYQEYLFANNWWQFFLFITDGKLYSAHMEHSAIEPMPRGAPFLCLDATTGELVWRADGLFRSTRWGGRGIIGDSVMVGMDTYDNRIYAVGKGPSCLNVDMTTDVTTQGRSILIKGKVTDVSPGTEDIKLRLRFPNGVPAVADESMSAWMLHVYKQFECPVDVKGVDVFVKIEDPNGEYYSETVTADGSGAFSMAWTPQVVGIYKVTVQFLGSNSYYPSWATTSFVVDPTPAAPAYNGPTAEQIAVDAASRTIAMLPAYPNVPTQEAIADDAARRTIAMLPQYPTPYPPAEIPAYQTVDIVIIALVVVAIIIGIYIIIKKK